MSMLHNMCCWCGENPIVEDTSNPKQDLCIKCSDPITGCETREWIVQKKFLEKYIVPNFYLPRHLGVKDSEIMGFKKFVVRWGCSGAMEEIMVELLENFRQENSEEDEGSSDEDIGK
eukprot:SAG31_NODE_354_length_17223_cov_18.708771_7_plen_117_part_00